MAWLLPYAEGCDEHLWLYPPESLRSAPLDERVTERSDPLPLRNRLRTNSRTRGSAIAGQQAVDVGALQPSLV
jgi:hypothetical protein